ncbi:MAG: winged helix-turn-helix transcriptional regulator [Chlorobia bacterium]|nr:winged helix-turn-helix transcriptional regulator [Fimbriimonadaceae bacterium]
MTLDRVFYALSDSTRRDILGRVARGPVAVSELAKRYQMSLPAVVKHLGVLGSCGLVKTDKVGRVRSCTLDAAPLKAADDWIETYRVFWEGRFDRLGEYLNELSEDPAP